MGLFLLTAASALAAQAAGKALPRSPAIHFEGPFTADAEGVHNIHISFASPVDGELSVYYGSCDMSSPYEAHHRVGTTHIGDHPLAKRHMGWESNRPTRFTWLPPADTFDGGCLHAFSGEESMGRSASFEIKKRKTRRSVTFAEIADAMGPWFDGVEYLKEKEPDSVFVSQAKEKTIGILGGGMAGLMTSHLLDSVGIYNWEILEATERVGGRVHTSYLNNTTPDEYQYQEMGPMRFPVSITNSTTNETIQIMDHRMVFQLADTMNKLNGNDSSLAVNFIKWIQSAVNDPEDATNTTATYSNVTAVEEALAQVDAWDALTWEKKNEIATNVFQAHKKAVEEGYFDFSEASYLRYVMHQSADITDQAVSTATNSPEWLYDSIYFGATEWRTIDKGLSSLPRAFMPHVANRTRFSTKVEKLSYDDEAQKMTVSWRPDGPWSDLTSAEYDYTVVAVPFTRVRLWEMPDYSSLLSRAISSMNYGTACKVALHYETRFWEHLDAPIIGGCGSTNISGIGSICYPSYQINSTLPGVILASYDSDDTVLSWGGLTDDEHVAYVQRAMVAIHGDEAAKQYTGNYDRICWINNEYESGSWASPLVGQQELYLPAYFKTEKHTVFIGEHTSYTHAWIFSALESAVRGTTQLLLDMGLVDEAKQVTDEWMARWISV
ncbi:flavin-containing amine oxidoreductase-domain containing protein [Phyllosticta capitalensis]